MIRKDTKKIKIRAQLAMGKSHSADGYSISLSIEDTASGLHIAELNIPLEGFGSMVGGGTTECDATIYQNENLGKTMEVKHLEIPLEGFESTYEGDSWNQFNGFAEDFVLQNWGAAWKLDFDPNKNSHRVNHKKNTYQMIARKWT